MQRHAGNIVPRGRIARRLILALVLFSSLITAITTAVQLFVDYSRGVSEIEKSFRLIESSYLEGLTNSMWSFDDGQIKILLTGMSKLPDMEFVSIEVDGETKWSVGARMSENVLTTEFPMRVDYRGEQWTIGVLNVVASLSSIIDRLWQDFVVILVSNAVKTFFVVGFVFVLFHRMVTQRLDRLVTAIKGLGLDPDADTDRPIVELAPTKNPDEINEIEIALADMHGDLTRTHQSVREREQEMRIVTDNLPGSVIHVGLDQRYQFVNKRTEEWLQRSAAEIIGRPVREILGETNYAMFRPHIEAALSGKIQDFEATVTYADGIKRDMEITYVPDLGLDGTVAGYFALALDVSERHLLEERLKQSQKMEAVGQLTGGIAHEFNNLLQVISGNLELLESNGQFSTNSDQRFAAIHRNVDRGADLTDRLLSFSRRQPLAPREVDVARILGSMRTMLGQTLGETISVEVHSEPDVWPAEADPGQLENALLNLALNARDAMTGGGKIVLSAANVVFDAESVGEHDEAAIGEFVEICVRDNGPGMSGAVKNHAFEPFFTTKDIGKGTGLGLSMVYGFAQQSGGFARIESEPGQGTSIMIYLPRGLHDIDSQAEEAAVHAPSASFDNGPTPTSIEDGKTVLLVEDDADVRAALRDQITALGYLVMEANDGDDALSKTKNGLDVDLLFTDIVMPGKINGLELARQLRGQIPGLRVIYTTGYSDEIVSQSGQLDENAVILRKPYDRSALADILSQTFEA